MFDAVKALGVIPEFRWYHGLLIVLIFKGDFFIIKNSVLDAAFNQQITYAIKKTKKETDSIYVY